jgi:hypothetical protein
MKKTFLRVCPGERFVFKGHEYECREPATVQETYFEMKVRDGQVTGSIYSSVNVEVDVVSDDL